MLDAVTGFLKSVFGGKSAQSIGTGQSAAADGGGASAQAREHGQAASTSGDNSPVEVIGVQNNYAVPQTPRGDWWRRDGSPEVKFDAVMARGSQHLEGTVRFTAVAKEVELRVFGAGAVDKWYTPSPTGLLGRNGGMAFHLRAVDLDSAVASEDVPPGEVRVEARFWWGEEECHVLWGGPVADAADPAKRLPRLRRWSVLP